VIVGGCEPVLHVAELVLHVAEMEILQICLTDISRLTECSVTGKDSE
jgi:hypothetical protein